MTLLTAKEMAKMLRRTEKTFNKNVRDYGVPFIEGKPRLFNPDEVLSILTASAPIVSTDNAPKPKKRSASLDGWTKQDEKFAQELGITL